MLEEVRQTFRNAPAEWWLKYRVHVSPRVEAARVMPTTEARREEIGKLVGTLVHRLMEMPAIQRESTKTLTEILKAMAMRSLASDGPAQQHADQPGDGPSANESLVGEVADSALKVWSRLRDSDQGRSLRELLAAPGRTEVDFALRLGCWNVIGRFDKLLRVENGLEIIDWKTDAALSNNLERYKAQMKLYVLALVRAKQAAISNDGVRVYLAMLHHEPRLELLRFHISEIEAFERDLILEFAEMSVYAPGHALTALAFDALAGDH
jgi:ATP-dependent exoDNAse (exonuclease V) beta subunit